MIDADPSIVVVIIGGGTEMMTLTGNARLIDGCRR